jgi:3-methyladenine DNA glycosylase AlkD
MIEKKLKEIKDFCIKNSDLKIVEKYSRYFKEGYNGYGIDQKIFEHQKDRWIESWKGEMTIEDYLELGDRLVQSGKLEEVSLAVHFLASQKENYTPQVFDRIGHWFDIGISNWANTDVLCMLVLPNFLTKKIITLKKIKEWTTASSEWKRRAVPVTLVEMTKKGIKPSQAIPLIEPLMLDKSEYVQKGIGTLLRELWKKYPFEVEQFLMKWKDSCGRLIIRYATEKMDKEDRKKFRKSK